MAFLSDILLLLAALSAAFYCRVLAQKLRRLSATDKGLGGAISALSAQVEDLQAVLNAVRGETTKRAGEFERDIARAETAARRLELLLAALHEPEAAAPPPVSDAVLRLTAKDQKSPRRDRGEKSRVVHRVLPKPLRLPEHAE